MSIQIIKKGLSDSIQDKGRYGYQHIGIQPSGCMDFYAAWLGNLIVQNPLDAPVVELHFPSSHFKFETDYIICITGANFVPVINEKSVALNTAIQVKQNDILSMLQPIAGNVAYLAINGKLNTPAWLNSQSDSGKRLEKDNTFEFIASKPNKALLNKIDLSFIEQIHEMVFDPIAPIRILPGPAWKDLSEVSMNCLLNTPFTISKQANRMGFHLNGEKINLSIPNAYLSSAVTRGTLQLLPNGEIIVLMADHQTIGGYANLGQIILVDLPRFAQMKSGHPFHFSITNLETAHQLYQQIYEQYQHRY